MTDTVVSSNTQQDLVFEIEGPVPIRPEPSEAEMRRALREIFSNRDRIELRVIHKPKSSGKPKIEVGVFDRQHLDELIRCAIVANATATVCVNVNPVLPSYPAPSVNALSRNAVGLVGNEHIARREFLFIDCDPQRPSGTSATKEQVQDALITAQAICSYLKSQGWPSPLEAASGNGAHLLYRIDLPNDDRSRQIIEGVLGTLGDRFDSESIKIDRSVGKAGQIIKFYGTVANKGEHAATTPHRLSRILKTPSPWLAVSLDQLLLVQPPKTIGRSQALGDRPSWLPTTPTANGISGGGAFDLNGFLKKLGIPFQPRTRDDGTESFQLEHCPFNPDHNRGEAGISRHADGRLGFHCFHNSCAEHNWHSLRRLVEQKAPTALPFHKTTDEGTEGLDATPQPRRLPPALKPVPRLDPDLLPQALRPAAVDIADRLQCPVEYLAVSMLAAAGAVVGNRVGIFPYANDESWEVYPALWGGIVGDPGTKKSPAIQAAHRPLRHLEEVADQEHAKAMQQYDSLRAHHEAAMAQWMKNKAGMKPVAPAPPKKRRLIVNDVTYQALGVILEANPRGVLAFGDELSGLLQALDSPGQEAARGFFLSGWSGTQGYSFDRIGRGSIVLPRYCLAVFGGFQPDRLKGYVSTTQRGSNSNDGLMQRFQLLVWPDSVEDIKLVDRKPDQAAINAYNQAVIKLNELDATQLTKVQVLPNGSAMLHFNESAQLIFNGWLIANERLIASGRIDQARQSHLAKYRSLIPSLALLFHLLNGHTASVCEECIANAIRFARFLKRHADRIYASVSGHDLEATRTLARHLVAGSLPQGFTCRAVVMKGWSGLSSKARAQEALEALVEFGWLHAEEVRIGRPTVKYYLHPQASEELL